MKSIFFTSVAVTALVVGMGGAQAQTSQSSGADKPAATSGSTPAPSSTKPDAKSGDKGASSTAPGQPKPDASSSASGKSESAPRQTKPDATTAAPGKPEAAPGQTKTDMSTSKPTDTKPADTKPAAGTNTPNTKPATGDAATKPADTKPASGDATAKPADTKPASGDATAKPADAKAQDTKATDTKPASGTPSSGSTGNTSGNTGAGTSGSSSSSSTSAASSSAASSATVNLNSEQQTKVTQAFSSVNAQPVTNVNFSVSVGTVINEQVTFHDLPPTIVEVVPQFRGYRYIVVRDQIVIVEPQSKKIVYVMSRSGGSGKRTSLSISGEKRAMVKKTLVSGPKITKTIKVEEDMVVPQDIELSTVSETVVSDLPELRSYRYFVVEDQVVIVEPETRRVIEIIR